LGCCATAAHTVSATPAAAEVQRTNVVLLIYSFSL
jgi:hypothetical protein